MNKNNYRFARRIHSLAPEGADAVLAEAQLLEASGQKIIHMEIGQPDFQTFANIDLAGIRAIANDHTGYTHTAGIPELQKEIAAYTSDRVGKTFSLHQVVVGPGAKPLLFFP